VANVLYISIIYIYIHKKLGLINLVVKNICIKGSGVYYADHSCKVTIQLVWWFLTRRFSWFQPIRTRYWPWQPCWISDLHQKHKSGRGPSNEHLWQVWWKSSQRFQRRRVKCEKLTDGRLSMTKANTELFLQYFIRIIIICGQCSLYFYYIYIYIRVYS
jgi:hypothetical protein